MSRIPPVEDVPFPEDDALPFAGMSTLFRTMGHRPALMQQSMQLLQTAMRGGTVDPRLKELLDDATVDPAVLRDMLPRLERFVKPFAALLATPEQQTHLHEYVSGLVSNLERKNVEEIAYYHDQERQALQKFIGQVPWDHRPLVTELARQVGAGTRQLQHAMARPGR